MATIDHTKAVYYSGYNAYKNEGVFETAIQVTGDAISAGTIKFWETTITVPDIAAYATVAVQGNEMIIDVVSSATPLRWMTYPSVEFIAIPLTTDPYNTYVEFVTFQLEVNGSDVTFSVGAFNPYDQPIAFSPTTIGVQYAIHSVD